MPYYMAGDYYRGGDAYYQAGGLFSSIGKFFGGALKVASGFVTGGPVGAAQAVLQQVVHPASQAGKQLAPVALTGPVAPQTYQVPQLPPIDQYGIVNINRMGPGGAGFMTGGGVGGGVPGRRGTHLNKHAYETRGGGTSRWGPAGNLQLHPAGTVEVSNRHMNVGNAKALKHALRRAYGFERLARRVLRITSPKKHVSGFKRSRRRK